jgi:hypothetical protein
MMAACCCEEFTVCPQDGWRRLTHEAGQGWLLPGNTDGPHRKDEKCLEAPQPIIKHWHAGSSLVFGRPGPHQRMGAECTVSGALQHGQEGEKGQIGVGNHRTSSPSLGSGGCFLGLALLLFLRGDNIQQAPAP